MGTKAVCLIMDWNNEDMVNDGCKAVETTFNDRLSEDPNTEIVLCKDTTIADKQDICSGALDEAKDPMDFCHDILEYTQDTETVRRLLRKELETSRRQLPCGPQYCTIL